MKLLGCFNDTKNYYMSKDQETLYFSCHTTPLSQLYSSDLKMAAAICGGSPISRINQILNICQMYHSFCLGIKVLANNM